MDQNGDMGYRQEPSTREPMRYSIACAVLFMLPLVVGCGANLGTYKENDVTVSVSSSRDLPYAVSFHVTLPQPGQVEIHCQGVDDPLESHRIGEQQVAEEHTLDLVGLLADNTYTCQVDATLDGEPVTGPLVDLTTLTAPDGLPDWSLEGDPDAIVGVYTLFNHMDDGKDADNQKALIVDPQGRVRWYHAIGDSYAGDVDTRYLGDGRVLIGGGYGYRMRILDMLGERLWRAPVGRWHHHAEELATGQVVGLLDRDDLGEDGDDPGFEIQALDPANDEVVFSWTSQEAVDQGAITPSGTEPFHANSVTFWPPEEGLDAPAFYVNLRNISAILKVDRDSGEVLWKLSYNDDFTMLSADGSAGNTSDWFFSQHAPEFTEDSVLVYDNSTSNPSGGATRALELSLDQQTMTVQVLWEYTEDGWAEPYWGDADDIGGGHVLIAVGHCEDCESANPDNRSTIVEVDRATHEPVWRIDFPAMGDALYRAQRIGGCDIFNNERYCSPD